MFALFARLLVVGHRRHVAVLLSGAVICLFAGATAFAGTQHIPFTSALYWAVTTATTVGYGDVTPHNGAGRIVASAVMLTCIPMLGATFALLTGSVASSALRKVLGMRSFPEGPYRLVLGSHPSVPAIIDELARADDAVVLVADADPSLLREGVHLVRGDPTQPETIERARPAGAVHCLVTGQNDGDVLMCAVLIRNRAPGTPVAALVHSRAVREALSEIGVEQIVSIDELTAHTMAKSVESPHAGDLLLKLISSEKHKLVELDPDESTLGKTLSGIRGEQRGLVLGIVRGKEVSLGVGEDPTLSTGDRLLLAVPIPR